MTFDFERIKVLHMLKKMAISPKEFKGVLDHQTGKLWPFGSDRGRELEKRKFKDSFENNENTV